MGDNQEKERLEKKLKDKNRIEKELKDPKSFEHPKIESMSKDEIKKIEERKKKKK